MIVGSVGESISIEGQVTPDQVVNYFSRRYVPDFEVGGEDPRASIVWKLGRPGVIVEERGKSRFVIRSDYPEPYRNEHPYFFLLQVFSRLYEESGRILLSDSVVFSSGKEGVVVMGGPHSGKSTLLYLAILNGFIPLSNENSVFSLKGGKLVFEGGATTFTFSRRAAKYGSVVLDGTTRSGYGYVDLRKFDRKRVTIKGLFYIHSSFSSKGFDMEKISGRKVKKLLWSHASSVIRGTEFYSPYPPDLSSEDLNRARAERISDVADFYGDSFYEVFGAHDAIFEFVKEFLR